MQPNALPKQHSPQPLPAQWIDRLFDRFKIAWGVQKVGAMWEGIDPPAVMAEWAQQLGCFPAHVLRQALQAVIDSGDDWPPSLPKFVGVCRDFHRPESLKPENALPAPGQGHTDAASAAAQLARIREMMGGAVKPMAHKAD